MKVKLRFTLKILLPYLVLLSLIGMGLALVLGMTQHYWLKRHLRRVGQLVTRLTRGIIPSFVASKASDEIGDLERSLESHVSHLKDIAAYSRSLATGDYSGSYDKLNF